MARIPTNPAAYAQPFVPPYPDPVWAWCCIHGCVHALVGVNPSSRILYWQEDEDWVIVKLRDEHGACYAQSWDGHWVGPRPEGSDWRDVITAVV